MPKCQLINRWRCSMQISFFCQCSVFHANLLLSYHWAYQKLRTQTSLLVVQEEDNDHELGLKPLISLPGRTCSNNLKIQLRELFTKGISTDSFLLSTDLLCQLPHSGKIKSYLVQVKIILHTLGTMLATFHTTQSSCFLGNRVLTPELWILENRV